MRVSSKGRDIVGRTVTLTDEEWGMCIGALDSAASGLDEGAEAARRVNPGLVGEIEDTARNVRALAAKLRTAAGIIT